MTSKDTPLLNCWLASLAAWLVPGLGHFLLGRKKRALLYAVLVLSALAIGLYLRGHLWHFEIKGFIGQLASLACLGLGTPFFILEYLTDYAGDMRSIGYEYGKAYILSAGIMNLLLVLDAWDIARGEKP